MENYGVPLDAKMGSQDCPEESSWTFYIRGFICDNIDNDDRLSSSEFESPSLVSDAASSAVKKLTTGDRHGDVGFCSGGGTPPPTNTTMCKQTSFKKQKITKVIPAMDHDLEDTASSPVNSPKVSYINQFSNKKEKAKMDASEVQRNIFGKGGVFAVERDTNCADYKRRTTS